MATEEDFLSTPSNYATPKQIDAVREYAKALMTGSGQQPVKHWTQGVANLLQQLRGENLLWGSGNQEVGMLGDAARQMPKDPGDPAYVAAALKGEGSPTARIPMRPGAGVGLPFSDEPSEIPQKASDPNNPMNWLGYEMDTPNGKVGGTFDAQPSPSRRVQEGFNDVSLGFSGEPSPDALSGVGSSAATALALAAKAGVQPPGPNLGVGTRVAGGPEDASTLTGPLPHRVPVTRQQLERVLTNPYASPEIKKFVTDSYYQQRQPIEAAGTGGKWMVDPTGKVQPRFVPDLQKGTAKLPGGMEMPIFNTIQPGPNGPVLKNIDEAAAPVAPKPPAANLNNVPNLLKYADEGAKPPGMLGAALPPEITGGRSATPEEKVQTAQLPSYIDRMWQDSTKKDIEFEAAKEHAKKDVDAYDKKYDLFMSAGKQAQNALPQIELASRALENPNFYSGIGADLVVDWKRLMSQISKNPNAAAANEVFDKVISGNILGDLKAVLQGLGQVRVAEIDLLGKATANKYMSVPANRAVLDLMKRAHGQTDMISRITNAYGNGVRWNDKGEPYQTSERPTNAGLDKTVKTWMDAHPLVDKPTLENYTKLFEQDPAYKPKEADKRRKQIEAIRTGQSTPSTPTAPTSFGAEPPPGFRPKAKAAP